MGLYRENWEYIGKTNEITKGTLGKLEKQIRIAKAWQRTKMICLASKCGQEKHTSLDYVHQR